MLRGRMCQCPAQHQPCCPPPVYTGPPKHLCREDTAHPGPPKCPWHPRAGHIRRARLHLHTEHLNYLSPSLLLLHTAVTIPHPLLRTLLDG